MKRVEMAKPALGFVDGEFTIHRFDPTAEVPAEVAGEPFCWVARTDEELSVVCRASIEISGEMRSGGWIGLRFLGPLEFELTGILAGIAARLADAGVPIIALSTYDTDYLLLKAHQKERATTALEAAGYRFS